MKNVKRGTIAGMIIGVIPMGFLGIMMVLMDPDTERLIRTDPLSVLPVFVLFVLIWGAMGAFMGAILGTPSIRSSPCSMYPEQKT